MKSRKRSSDAVAKATSSIPDSRLGNFKKSSLVDKSRKADVHYRKVYYRREHISRLLTKTHVLSACIHTRIQGMYPDKRTKERIVLLKRELRFSISELVLSLGYNLCKCIFIRDTRWIVDMGANFCVTHVNVAVSLSNERTRTNRSQDRVPD